MGQGPVQILPWGLLKGAGINFCCLFDGSHVSGICVLCCVVVGGLVVCVCVGGGGGVRGPGWPGGYSCTELGEGGFSL